MGLVGGAAIDQRVVVVAGWPGVAVARLARRELARVSLPGEQKRQIVALIEMLESLDDPMPSREVEAAHGPVREVTVAQAAEMLGVSERQARNLTAGMPCRVVGRARLVDAEAVEALVEARRVGPPAA